jgi:hypothetical protein
MVAFLPEVPPQQCGARRRRAPAATARSGLDGPVLPDAVQDVCYDSVAPGNIAGSLTAPEALQGRLRADGKIEGVQREWITRLESGCRYRSGAQVLRATHSQISLPMPILDEAV